MPTYRSITISLVSQFDILTIPEYAPPATPTDPFSNAPTLVDPDHSLVSIYIPIYPSSQFWISYSIAPPYPPRLLYYFKLYLNGQSVVSWGCGEEDGYKGKTMFGLYDSGRSITSQPAIERRVLCFAPESRDIDQTGADNTSNVLEVKVFRSKGRKRIHPQIHQYCGLAGRKNADRKALQQQTEGGVDLLNGGLLPNKYPQRFYQYALLDPLDQPFAAFRYYYRSWDQLEALGVISPEPSTESSSIESHTLVQPLSPPSSNKTLTTHVSTASTASTAESANAGALKAKATESVEVNHQHLTGPNIKGVANITKKEIDTRHSPGSTTSSSSPIRLPRPTTPQKAPNPSKIPIVVPLTPLVTSAVPRSALKTPTPNPQTKDTFASIVRTHFPSPDLNGFKFTEPPNPFKLTEVSLDNLPRPSSPLKISRSGSMGALMSVVSHAVNRRRRAMSSVSEGDVVNETSDERREQRETNEGGIAEIEQVGETEGPAHGNRQGKKGKDGEGSDDGSRQTKDGKEKVSARQTDADGRRRRETSRSREGRKMNLWEEL